MRLKKYITGYTSALAAGVSFGVLLSATPAYANPEGGVVVSGTATFSQSGNTLNVTQTTNRALIDWRSFNIAEGEHTQFLQPSASAVAVNRILDTNPSTIAGRLSANGNLVLLNPNGMIFSNTAVVDVNGIVASTSMLDKAAFDQGLLQFTPGTNPDAQIINNGLITAADAGLVGLVAPQVENNGIITAKLGHIQLASADTYALDFYGDGLINIAVTGDMAKQLVKNTGELHADGGTVALTAATARQVVDSLIQVEGELAAPTVATQGGKIFIQNENDTGAVVVQATLDASGRDPQEGVAEKGGQVEILGGDITLKQGTLIDASGDNTTSDVTTSATLTDDSTVRPEADFMAQFTRAGGSIKIGGDYLGLGDTQTAQTVTVEPYTVILNDALTQGDGGRTIVWADGTTDFGGFIFSRGGTEGGQGGFVETSGKEFLNAYGYVDLRARAEGYHNGAYLLDPANISIYGNVDAQFQSTDGTVDLTQDQVLSLAASVIADIADYYNGSATATHDYASLSVVPDADITRTANVIMTVGIDIPASPSGVIYEQGGSGYGTYVGFMPDGTLVFHAGRGSSFNASDAAHLEIAPGSAPTGSGTLSWNIDVGSNTLTAYWNGVEIGSNTASSAFTQWSGGDDGGFGTVTNSYVSGANAANFNGTFTSNLKYYDSFGNFLADSSSANNATTVTSGTPTVSQNVLNGQAAVILDDGETFEITDTNDINLQAQAGIARSFTFKTDADVTTQQIVYKEGGSSNGYVVYLEGGTLRVGLYNGGVRSWRAYTVTPNTTYQLSTVFDGANNNFTAYLNGVAQSGNGLGAGTSFSGHSGDIAFGAADSSIRDENSNTFTPTNTVSTFGQAVFYNAAIDDEVRQVLDQYSAAKFGAQLDGPGTGSSIVERATASDGYSVFTTRYLEQLSSMADVNLLASNNITLDLKGDTLTMATGRSLSLTATSGQISELSSGAIVTNNGNITLNAGTNINLTQTSLQAGGTGNVNITAGGDVYLQQAKSLNFGTVSANSVYARTTGSTSDITLGGAINTTSSSGGNLLTLVSGRNFVNNVGANALQTASGRWLVYSADPTQDTLNNLSPSFRKFDAPYASNLPASLSQSGNGLLYVTATIPSYLQTQKTLPTTVARVMQTPALQVMQVESPQVRVQGDVFEMAEPLRIEIESASLSNREDTEVGMLRLSPELQKILNF